MLNCQIQAVVAWVRWRSKSPFLFIPSPNVAENHQYKNAMAIANEEAAVVIEEKELEHRFQSEIDSLLTDVEWRTKLGKNIKKLAKPNATKSIVEQINALVND